MAIESLQNKTRILIVEDDFALRSMLALLMQSLGYEVYQEENGSSAVRKVLDLRPDLILLDVNLPGMKGTEICGKVKSDVRVKDIPILMMTGEFREIEDKVEGFDRGADDYVVKPVDIGILIARVRAILGAR
jgi:DNA-binding response OmpR family regulator